MADDQKIIFSMNKVSKTYSSTNKQVLKDIYLSFFYGAKIGILGLNGAGKSSLLKIIAGIDKNYQGEVVFAPGYTVGYLEQEPKLDEEKTVIEVVREGVAETMKLLEEFNHINDLFGLEENYSDPDKMQKLMDKQAELQDKIDALNAWEIDNQLEVAMDALRTPDPDTPIKVLSGGERRRVALCRLLLQQPDVLLLDEPTNHLDAESVLWLEQHLQQYAGTVIAVTHDRYFLDNVAGWILELDRGEGIPWKGNYSSWLDQKAKRLAQEQKAETKRQKVLERELEWVRQGAKGRQAKQKARLQNYDRLLSEDQKQLEEKLEIYIPNGPRLGTNVIEARHVSKAFGDKLLYDDLNFVLPQAGIVGVIGPNGAGKSTLIKLLAGELTALSGTVQLAKGVQLGYFAQHQLDTLRADESALWHMQKLAPEQTEQKVRDYLGSFAFHGDKVNQAVKAFSGGEKARLVLALIVWQRPNLLLLDEPTNHLDLDMRQALTEALVDYEGSLVVVSHDRHLLRNTVEEFYLVHDKKVEEFKGDLEDYQKWLNEQNSAPENKSSEKNDDNENSMQNRKEQKRREAELRQQTAPLRKQISQLEEKMNKHAYKLAEIENQLADSELYSAENKEKLTALLAQQVEVKKALEEVEMDWLAAQEELEAMLQA